MPKRALRNRCVPESVLLSHGEVKTILLDERYAPFAGQGARLENLCGSFTEQVLLVHCWMLMIVGSSLELACRCTPLRCGRCFLQHTVILGCRRKCSM